MIGNYSRKSFLMHNRFTLVEMLVVIAILSILASLLLPTLNKALDQAYTITCLNNISQIGKSMMLYSNDYRQYPSQEMNYKGGPTMSIWFWQDYLAINYLTGKPCYVSKLFQCPKETKKLFVGTQYGANIYSYLKATTLWADTFFPARLPSALKSPSKTSLMVENYGHSQYLCHVNPPSIPFTDSSTGLQAAAFRHNESATVVYHDGHSQARMMDIFPCREAFPALSGVNAIYLQNTYFNFGGHFTNWAASKTVNSSW